MKTLCEYNAFQHLKITLGCMTHLSIKMSHEQHFCYLMVYGIYYEIYHDNCLIFTTFVTYCAVLRSFDGKSVKNFHLSLQKKRNIPTLYEKVHNFLGHPVVNNYGHVEMVS